MPDSPTKNDSETVKPRLSLRRNARHGSAPKLDLAAQNPPPEAPVSDQNAPAADAAGSNDLILEIFEKDNLPPELRAQWSAIDPNAATVPAANDTSVDEATRSGPTDPEVPAGEESATDPIRKPKLRLVKETQAAHSIAQEAGVDSGDFPDNMLIGDSPDQIARGPGRLTPEDDGQPHSPPPPINAPVLFREEGNMQDAVGEPLPERAIAEKPSERISPSPLTSVPHEEPESSKVFGRRFWISLGLVAAIAGAAAFTLSMLREPAASSIPAGAETRDSAFPALRVSTGQTVSAESGAPALALAGEEILSRLALTMVYPDASLPRIVVNDVSFPVGSLLEPETGLRFTGIDADTRVLSFEDAEGRILQRSF